MDDEQKVEGTSEGAEIPAGENTENVDEVNDEAGEEVNGENETPSDEGGSKEDSE